MALITPSAWSITKDDLPYIKKLLSVILQDHAGSSLRLEIFARLSGFKTFASLKSRLENFSDINGKPFPVTLQDKPVSDPDFFSKLPIEARRHLADAEETGLTRMIIAGLHKCRHPVLGDLGFDETTTLDNLRQSANNLFHPSSSGRNIAPLIEEHKTAAIVVTPENIQNIRTHSGLPLDGADCFAVFALDFCESDPFPRLPATNEIISTDDPSALAEMLSGRKVYAYSTQDIFSIKKALGGNAVPSPRDYIQLKDAATKIEEVPFETDIFTLGCVLDCDIPEDLSEARPEDAVFWLLDILTFVHAYQKEEARMVTAGQ